MSFISPNVYSRGGEGKVQSINHINIVVTSMGMIIIFSKKCGRRRADKIQKSQNFIRYMEEVDPISTWYMLMKY